MRPDDAGTALQIAFMTGRSDPARCGLSPQQSAFLAALGGPGRRLHRLNFPYLAALDGHRPVALPLAAWRNAWQYLSSRRPAFARRHRDAVLRMLDEAPHTVLLAGSCGLELLANLRLPPAYSRRLSVFAYGPVARGAPDCRRLLCVRGRRDGISLRGFRGRAETVEGGHMDYLRSDEVRALCERFVQRVADAEATCAST
ncbi:hypothetical protein [Luteimonas huabeiensis]|uniref:hypothetical protein n=1 Tax=Luteimonas huabeiensis TaxID=1244513 RepID=UPI000467768C|nr:hypothetical protein [Luteimonas huabeiensis]